MTSSEKETAAGFLDTVFDYLTGGYRRDRDPRVFPDDPCAAPGGMSGGTDDMPANAEGGAPRVSGAAESGIPLAYFVAEADNGYEAVPPLSAGGNSGNADAGEDSVEKLNAEIRACERCGLARERSRAVPGEGAIRPLVMIIGGEPDAGGRPFADGAGALLDRMLASIGLSRETNCFVTNAVKCRPESGRGISPEESAACFPFLERGIKLLKPSLILCAGRAAARSLLRTGEDSAAPRGEFAEFHAGDFTIPALLTFHPGDVLLDETLKRPAWEDLKLLRAKLSSVKGGDV